MPAPTLLGHRFGAGVVERLRPQLLDVAVIHGDHPSRFARSYDASLADRELVDNRHHRVALRRTTVDVPAQRGDQIVVGWPVDA